MNLFLSQIALNLAAIWLGLYLYFRQQREAQNERYEELRKSIDGLGTQLKDLSASFGAVHHDLKNELTHIKVRVAIIEDVTSKTQSGDVGVVSENFTTTVVSELITDKVKIKQRDEVPSIPD